MICLTIFMKKTTALISAIIHSRVDSIQFAFSFYLRSTYILGLYIIYSDRWVKAQLSQALLSSWMIVGINLKVLTNKISICFYLWFGAITASFNGTLIGKCLGLHPTGCWQMVNLILFSSSSVSPCVCVGVCEPFHFGWLAGGVRDR